MVVHQWGRISLCRVQPEARRHRRRCPVARVTPGFENSSRLGSQLCLWTYKRHVVLGQWFGCCFSFCSLSRYVGMMINNNNLFLIVSVGFGNNKKFMG
ncbi:hypothetical protein LINGRAPRIM_LOCUS3055 [Linum grandiflorum]